MNVLNVRGNAVETASLVPKTTHVERIRGEDAGSLVTAGTIGASIFGVVGILGSVFTGDPANVLTFASYGGGFVLVDLPAILQRINVWFAIDHIISKQTDVDQTKKPNIFQTKRSLRPKRHVISQKHDANNPRGISTEVHLVTNLRGVWIETVKTKNPLTLWDDSMVAVVRLYSLSNLRTITKGVSPS